MYYKISSSIFSQIFSLSGCHNCAQEFFPSSCVSIIVWWNQIIAIKYIDSSSPSSLPFRCHVRKLLYFNWNSSHCLLNKILTKNKSTGPVHESYTWFKLQNMLKLFGSRLWTLSLYWYNLQYSPLAYRVTKASCLKTALAAILETTLSQNWCISNTTILPFTETSLSTKPYIPTHWTADVFGTLLRFITARVFPAHQQSWRKPDIM